MRMSRIDLVGFSEAPHLNHGTASAEVSFGLRRTPDEKLFDGGGHFGRIPGEAVSQFYAQDFPVEFDLIKGLTVKVDSAERIKKVGYAQLEMTGTTVGEGVMGGQTVNMDVYKPHKLRRIIASRRGESPSLRVMWHGPIPAKPQA